MIFSADKTRMVAREDALPGRATPMPTPEPHFLNGRDLRSPVPAGMAEAMFGMGCYWGVERKFWQVPGVWLSMVGFAGGYTPNPTYRETCTQLTGHNEVVRLIFDPALVSYEALLKLFFLALRNISKKWTMPIRDWKAALTRFTIQFEDRMNNL